jgi:hypothetical protein
MLTIFHSSIPTEIAPHYVRYYAAAYTFEAQPPFTPRRISTKPLMVGSEMDGHKVDPRYVDGWKPYVVFPCGLIPNGEGWLCSLGINDWQCAIAKLKPSELYLGAANGSDIAPRYFRHPNGSLPVKHIDDSQKRILLHWMIPRAGNMSISQGVMKCVNPREAQTVAEQPGVEEITFAAFEHIQMEGLRGR